MQNHLLTVGLKLPAKGNTTLKNPMAAGVITLFIFY